MILMPPTVDPPAPPRVIDPERMTLAPGPQSPIGADWKPIQLSALTNWNVESPDGVDLRRREREHQDADPVGLKGVSHDGQILERQDDDTASEQEEQPARLDVVPELAIVPVVEKHVVDGEGDGPGGHYREQDRLDERRVVRPDGVVRHAESARRQPPSSRG